MRDLIQRASSRARLKILTLLWPYSDVVQGSPMVRPSDNLGGQFHAEAESRIAREKARWLRSLTLNPLPSGEGKSAAPSTQRSPKEEGLGVRFLDAMSEQKTISDGTKLPLEGSRPKTTTYGMKLLFSPELDASESHQVATSTN